jgi:hypothetical protein
VTAPSRRAWIALAFALAALLASWSPLAAAFGLITGLGAVVLAFRARREGGRVALVALALALLASVASASVLARAAGVWRGGEAAPRAPSLGDTGTSKSLDAAAEQSRAARERAVQQVDPAPGSHPRN